MRIVALSFLCFLIGVVFLVPSFSTWSYPSGFEFFGPVTLMLTAMVLQIDGLRHYRLVQAVESLQAQVQEYQEKLAAYAAAEAANKAALESKNRALAEKENEAERLAEQLAEQEHVLRKTMSRLSWGSSAHAKQDFSS